jgi:hypothetical protein
MKWDRVSSVLVFRQGEVASILETSTLRDAFPSGRRSDHPASDLGTVPEQQRWRGQQPGDVFGDLVLPQVPGADGPGGHRQSRPEAEV